LKALLTSFEKEEREEEERMREKKRDGVSWGQRLNLNWS
jgi:hypothetical protein